MNIKRLLILIFSLLTLLFPFQVANAATVANTFQITTEGSQQTSPFIHNNMVVYTSLSDIWGYNIDTGINFPILERDGQQFTTGFFRNWVVYEDTPTGEVAPDVRIHNVRDGKDILVAGGPGPQTAGVTNGKVVAFLDGTGACGPLKVYDIRKKTTKQIINSTCHPIRISGDIIVYLVSDPAGTNIGGYDLGENQAFNISTDANFQEAPNIFGNNVVWHHYITGGYGDYEAIKMKNLKTGGVKTLYETNTDSLGAPTISNRYVVWSQSPIQHVNKIMGADLKTGEVFEIQQAGPHQNSHTGSSIWNNTAAWMSFRTGNGDIYGSIFKNVKNTPSPLLLDYIKVTKP